MLKRVHTFSSNKVFLITIILFTLTYSVYYFFTLKIWEKREVFVSDQFLYYSYLPAYFIENDLTFNFIDNKIDNHYHYLWYATNDGKKYIKMTMGVAFCQAPFFLIAHYISPHFGYQSNGFTFPYQLAFCFSPIFYALVGLIFIFKILRKYYSVFIAGITTLLIYFATNIFACIFINPGLSHSYGFLFMAASLFLFIKWIAKPNYLNSIILGICLGMLILIRPTNGLILILLGSYLASNCKKLSKLFEFIKSNWKFIALIVLFCFLVFIPQMLYWKKISGSYLFYSYHDSNSVERFYFNIMNVFYGLFGFRRGLFIYTPVMILAVFGFFLMNKTEKELKWPILIFLLVFILITLSWWCWWYGGSFGARSFIEVYALMVIPLAAFIRYINSSTLKRIVFFSNFGLSMLFKYFSDKPI
ncbi:MAG: hypothetical protein IPJ93_15635 [Bacteroidota bacterium]|nr:MAG: hypothetical protein IPJ93_15635 [Bacteroidota bacterium]